LAARKLLGKTAPRLWTPPLRSLRRETSAGYQLCEYADAVGVSLLPYQRWLAVHMLELNRDGTFRFRIVVVLIARQNGKTLYAQVNALFRLYVTGARLVLGVAQDLSMAREAQLGCIEMIEASPYLAADLAEVRRANGDELFRVANDVPIDYDDSEGDESLTVRGGGRYKIAAPSRRAGRGLSVDLLMIDEIREWRSYAPYSALSKTTLARENGVILAFSNAGDRGSVVLEGLRSAALAGRDDSIGLFEWSAEDNADIHDPRAWAAANPALGYTLSAQALRTAANSDPVGEFRTECLCQTIPQLDGAIDLAAWDACHDPAGNMAALRDRVCACFDISRDAQHCTLAVAARLPDGRVRTEIAGAWKDTNKARTELPGLLDRIKPQVTAWYPSGPAGALASVLKARPGNIELTGHAVAQACMEMSDLTRARRILHAGEEILSVQVRDAAKLTTGDGWRFTRKGDGHVDAVYSVAGAISTAMTLPEPRRARIRLLTG
jgi:hypothetical protein